MKPTLQQRKNLIRNFQVERSLTRIRTMLQAFLLVTALLICSVAHAQQRSPDTTRKPKVYWSDIIRLQNLNNELTRRIHKFDIPALKRDTSDILSAEIGNILPIIYKRTYPDTLKKP